MTDVTPRGPEELPRVSVDEYFGLVRAGVLSESDRVELLEGVIVAMAPRDPPHATAVSKATRVLLAAIGDHACVRCQLTFVAGRFAAPEPDVAVVPGRDDDYERSHPTRALLIVEVADASLAQDRLTKSRLYARAAVPDYWIVNLRDDVVEVLRDPEPESAAYRSRRSLRRGDRIALVSFPDTVVAVADLLPATPR